MKTIFLKNYRKIFKVTVIILFTHIRSVCHTASSTRICTFADHLSPHVFRISCFVSISPADLSPIVLHKMLYTSVLCALGPFQDCMFHHRINSASENQNEYT